MNKVIPLLWKAQTQIRNISVHIDRAEHSFLVVKSLQNAVKELQETEKIIQEALKEKLGGGKLPPLQEHIHHHS